MQPAQNPAQSHFVQNSRLVGLVIALLIFGTLQGLPPVFAQAQQLVVPPPVRTPVVAHEVREETAKEEKGVSFEEKYKDWPVVMLMHEGRITVREDWSYETYVHRKVFIQTKEGLSFGEVPINYDSDTEEVRVLRAVTVTPDGKEHPPAKVQDLPVYGEYGMYSSVKRKILSMPEVTPGAVIEVEYIKTTRRLEMPKAFWNIQYVELPFPMKEQKLSFSFPRSLGIQYKTFVKGWDPEIRHEGTNAAYSWKRVNYGPDTDPEEPLLSPPTAETIGDGIEFSSVKSWQDIAAWYYGLEKKNLKVTTAIRETAAKAVAGKMDVRDKVRAILEYLQKNFRYVSMSFGDYGVEPHPTDEVFRNKYGDCKDQSLLAKAMLESVGIKSDLVFFMTEESGSDPKDDLPLLGLYDHLLLKVYEPEGSNFYADPLLEGYDIGEYPMEYQEAHIFVITSDGGRFEKFPGFGEERISESVKETIEIRPDGSALQESEQWLNLDDSIKCRSQLRAMSADERGKFDEYLRDRLAGGGKALEVVWEGLDKDYGTVKTTMKTDRPDVYPVNDGLMVIDLRTESWDDGWSAKERKRPIFFPYNALDRKTLIYKIPADFEVMHLPKGLNLDNGFFTMRREIERKGNEITVSEIKRHRRAGFPASEYLRLKEFYDKLPALTEQRIILKKKES